MSERGAFDYLDVVPVWWKRSTTLKERFDLVELHCVAEQLSTGPNAIPYDNVLAQFRLSAQLGEFGFVGQRKVEKLLYLGPEIAKLLSQEDLNQITDDQLIDDERLRLTPLEIETDRCIRLMWASRSVLEQWLKNRRWLIPPWLAATRQARVSPKPDQPAVTALVLRLAQERGSPVKQADTEIRAACDALGATKPQRLAALRRLPKGYRYSKGAPPK